MTVRKPGNGLWQGAGAAAVGGAVAVVVAFGLGSGSSATRLPAGKPYDLYTHCGVSEARVGSQYYVAVHPLSDGAGNPPAGWGNPYQAGTMTQVSATEAVFTDTVGHRVTFRARPGAKTFLRVCS
ncbi:MAG TPA: hypothetical protein VKG80_04515 [Trebonia sp.]|nr:hypothetical protein [Trebonia sp.]